MGAKILASEQIGSKTSQVQNNSTPKCESAKTTVPKLFSSNELQDQFLTAAARINLVKEGPHTQIL